jgi:hypothetical protein
MMGHVVADGCGGGGANRADNREGTGRWGGGRLGTAVKGRGLVNVGRHLQVHVFVVCG